MEKVLKIAFTRNCWDKKTLNKTPRPPAAFYASYIQALSLTDFLKYLQNSIFPKFLHV